MAAAVDTSVGIRRQRAHLASERLASRHDGRDSPHVSQQGGENDAIDDQHRSQTAPSVGEGSGSRQAMQTGAIRNASAASESARATTTQVRTPKAKSFESSGRIEADLLASLPLVKLCRYVPPASSDTSIF
jgi:hypothetical protein